MPPPSLRVSGLFVYPLKSAAGIALERATLDAFGIRHDRRWLVTATDGTFLTQRDEPRLALVRTALEADALRLDAEGAGTLRIPLDTSGTRRDVRVWNDDTEGADTGEDAATWISAVIRRPARILFMPDDVVRPVDPRFASGDERVSFADAFPLLLITQASLDGLNRRLPEPLPMNRFRPNLVIDGADAPHAEDRWSRIRAGTIELDVVKPCARCVTTTIDQTTAVAGREPLRTLATYRRDGSKVMFGQNVIHRAAGVLALGDPVTVLSTSDAAP